MARLSSRTRACVLAGVALGATACGRAAKLGPPPAESLEIASVASGAVGALAGGTEAAPSGWRAPSAPDPEGIPEAAPDDEEVEDGGAPPPRDAAIESPEDIPL
jgi:hypothetical protein